MKKLLLFLATLLSLHTLAQKRTGASGFYLEAVYQNMKVPDGKTYLKAVADSLNLNGTIKIPSQMGIGAGMVFFIENFEWEMGFTIRPGSFNNGANTVSNSNTDAHMRISGFDLKTGLNFYLGKGPVFLGILLNNGSYKWDLLVNSTDPSVPQKFQQVRDATGTEGSNPWNIVDFSHERVLSFRLQAGVNLYFSKRSKTHLKLAPFYDIGSTKYNLYNASNQYLAAYGGPGKSKLRAFGLKMAILFGRN